jgi:hypothetical protein
MVEASILFKLLNTSILVMYKVFEHIDMLTIDIAVGQSALPMLWGLGRSSTGRRNGVGF